MCGINGSVGKKESFLPRMNAAIPHRGPDYTGVYEDGTVHLGHLLLSIREVTERSKQPYHKTGSPWVLVFNGQIYNTRALAREFSIPYNDLDTAVMYDLIEKVGWDFIRHIQGMFAIALYNSDEKRVRLYRDQSGQKPLYYGSQNGAFIFSSEIKAISAAETFSRKASSLGLMLAGALGYIPGRHTILDGVYKLDAGEVVTVREDGSFEVGRYENDAGQHYRGDPRDMLHALVEEHLQSKQKVALNLSGGMDSSLLLHEMKAAGHDLHTYTTFFQDAEDTYNEDALIARKLAKDYGTTHTEIEITKEIYLENFVRSYELIEDPNYNMSIPTYFEVAKREGASGDGNRVILSGDGGDEIFGGYPYYAESQRYEHLIQRITPFLFNAGKWARRGHYWHYDNPVERWLAFKYFDFEALSLDKKSVTREIKEIAARNGIATHGPVRDMMELDRAIWLAGENFIRSDKLYMSQSLEMRSPLAYPPLRAYFDARLTEHDYLRAGVNKQYLRRLYEGALPDYVVKREKKTGWSSPVRTWYDERFKNLFLSILADAPRGGIVKWDMLMENVQKKDTWPGKYMFLYLSLAILAKRYGISL